MSAARPARVAVALAAFAAGLFALALGAAPPVDAGVLVRGATVVGHGRVDLLVRGATIVEVGAALAAPGARVVDVAGRWIAPAFVDSHVHLAYLPAPDALAAGGLVAAVDLGSPQAWLRSRPKRPRILASGPLLTGPRGYPTQGWGYDGYGRECADSACVVAAVDELHGLGARVIKLAIEDLDDAQAAAAVRAAHAHGMRVAAHALGDLDARRAAGAGVDVLAHVPVQPLAPATVRAWAGRAVVTTLAAFGASEPAVANLRALRSAGAVVLYGTDFGNSREPGISKPELVALAAAGLDGAAVLDAGTAAPARFWGLADLGRVEPGAAAAFLVLAADPTQTPATLADPVEVWLDGARVPGD